MLINLSLFVWIVGLLIYILAKPDMPKLTEIGRLMFWVGLLAWLMGNPWHLGAGH